MISTIVNSCLFYECNFFSVQQPWTTFVACFFVACATILLKQCWRILLVQQCCSRMITMLFKHCSGNNLTPWQLLTFWDFNVCQLDTNPVYRDLTIYNGNLNGDVLRNKIIVHPKQRERIISSPNGLINNVLFLETAVNVDIFTSLGWRELEERWNLFLRLTSTQTLKSF